MSNGCEHSKFLQDIFPISTIGVDYYNENNIVFEFKETHAKKPRDRYFKIPLHQFLESDYFVFCIKDSEFYVHKARHLKTKYSFNNKHERAYIRSSVVKKNFIAKFKDVSNLKCFLDGLDVD